MINSAFSQLRPDLPVILMTRHGPPLEGEIDFYHELERALKASRRQLVVLSYHPAATQALSIPSVNISGIPEFWPALFPEQRGDLRWERIRGRHMEWTQKPSPLLTPASVWLWQAAIRDLVHELNPALAVLWNAEHCCDLLLRDALAENGSVAWRMERGFVPGTLHVDPDGILASTRLATDLAGFAEDDGSDYESLSELSRGKGLTWYAQAPSQRERFASKIAHLAGSRRVILFTEQVTGDTQRFLFSPRFGDSKSALAWLLGRVPRQDYFVLLKSHPLAARSRADYDDILGGGVGLYVDDASMEDCLGVASLVATVNSTTAYEALLAGKIPLLLGRAVVSDKAITYDLAGQPDEETDRLRVAEWLAQADAANRLRRWRGFFCHALKNHFTHLRAHPAYPALPGAVALARRLDANAQSKLPRLSGGFALAMDTFERLQNKHGHLEHLLRLPVMRLHDMLSRIYRRFVPRAPQSRK